MNKGSRTILIFFILIIIILISGVSISLYLLQQETQGRKTAESSLEDVRSRNMKIEAALKDAEKQIDVLKGKNKDADEKINNLLSEIDLDTALREEIKAENKKLKDTLEAEAKSKIELRQKLLGDLDEVQKKLQDAEAKALAQEDKSNTLQQKIDELQKKSDGLEKKLEDMKDVQVGRQVRSEIVPVPGQSLQEKVELDRIVITPETAKEGKVLNVDSETEFLIFDIGAKHGVKQGDVMSVYRGKTYLGDVKVSRVQEEMSAADFIPPFSSKKVRKNDQVVTKK